MWIVRCSIYPHGVFVYTLDEALNQQDTMCAAESQIGPAETSLPDDAASGHGYMREKANYLARMRAVRMMEKSEASPHQFRKRSRFKKCSCCL